MPSQRPFLRSKIARQILGLVIAAATVPTVLLFAYAITFFEAHNEAQARRRMHESTKLLGRQLLERLELYARTLELVRSEIRNHSASDALRAAPVVAGFEWIGVVRADGTVEATLHGAPHAGRAVRTGEGRGVPFVDRSSGTPAIVLSEPLRLEESDRRLLVGRIAGGALLAPLTDAMPEWSSVVLLDESGRVVHSSRPAPPAALLDSARTATSDHALFEGTGTDGVVQVGYGWPLSRSGRFARPAWTVVLLEPRERVFAPTARLWQVLPLVLGLSIALVCLVGAIQIRRRVEPVDVLITAARRVAGGDLGARAELPPTDELGILAHSFNGMAAQLQHDFDALATRAEIDRAVLSSLDRHEIATKFLQRLPGLVACDGLALTLIDGSRGERCALVEGGSVRPSRDEIVFGSEESSFLARLGDPGGARTLCDVPVAFRPPGARSADTWAFPVTVRGALGAVLAVSRQGEQVASRHYAVVGQLAAQLGVGLTNARLLEEIDRANWEMVEALSRAIDAKSPWTAGHSTRVTMIGLAIGRRLGLDDKQLESIHRCGLLHDIGKLGVPVEILDKPGRLTDEETAIMKQHPEIGARIMAPISAYADVAAAVRHHHEHFDGTGYPDGLAGEKIPLIARIFAVADVFDALASARPYREAWPAERAIELIASGAGTQFDPRVVEAFLAEVRQFQVGPGTPVGGERLEPEAVGATGGA
jgi:putative nucleotidyltransferase with HDIG domain